MADKKKKGSVLDIPGQLGWIGMKAAKSLLIDDYTSNISQVVNDANQIKSTLSEGKTQVVDFVNDIKKHGMRKLSNWFFDRSSDTDDADLTIDTDSDFDAGYQIGDEDSEEEETSKALDHDGMKDIARGQVNAMYKIAGKQAEVSTLNTAELQSTIVDSTAKIIAAMNGINTSNSAIAQRLDTLIQLQQGPEEERRSRQEEGLLDSSGVASLGSLFNQIKKSADSSLGTVKMITDLMSGQKQYETIAQIVDMVFDVKSRQIGALGGLSIDDIGNSINNTVRNAISDTILGGTKAFDKLDNIPMFGGFIKDILNDAVGVSRQRNPDFKSELSSEYTRDKATFDGITRQTIVEVIPDYLKIIAGALTGKQYNVSIEGHLTDKKVDIMQGTFTRAAGGTLLDTGMRQSFMTQFNSSHAGSQMDQQEFRVLDECFSNVLVWYCYRNGIVMHPSRLKDQSFRDAITNLFVEEVRNAGVFTGSYAEDRLYESCKMFLDVMTSDQNRDLNGYGYNNRLSSVCQRINQRVDNIINAGKKRASVAQSLGRQHQVHGFDLKENLTSIRDKQTTYGQQDALEREKEQVDEEEERELEAAGIDPNRAKKKNHIQTPKELEIRRKYKEIRKQRQEDWDRREKEYEEQLYGALEERLESFDLGTTPPTGSGLSPTGGSTKASSQNGIGLHIGNNEFAPTLFNKLDKIISLLGGTPSPQLMPSLNIPPIIQETEGHGDDDSSRVQQRADEDTSEDRVRADTINTIMQTAANDGSIKEDLPLARRMANSFKNNKLGTQIMNSWTTFKNNMEKAEARQNAETGEPATLGGKVKSKILAFAGAVVMGLVGKLKSVMSVIGQFAIKWLITPCVNLFKAGLNWGMKDIKEGFGDLFPSLKKTDAQINTTETEESNARKSIMQMPELLEKIYNKLGEEKNQNTGEVDMNSTNLPTATQEQADASQLQNEQERQTRSQQGETQVEAGSGIGQSQTQSSSQQESQTTTTASSLGLQNMDGSQAEEAKESSQQGQTQVEPGSGVGQQTTQQTQVQPTQTQQSTNVSMTERINANIQANRERQQQSTQQGQTQVQAGSGFAQSQEQMPTVDVNGGETQVTEGGTPTADLGGATENSGTPADVDTETGREDGGEKKQGLLSKILGKIGGIGKILLGVGKIILTIVAGFAAVKSLMQLVQKTLVTSLKPLETGLSKIIKTLTPVIKTIGKTIAFLAATISDVLGSISGTVGSIMETVGGLIGGIINALSPVLGVLTIIGDVLNDILQPLFDVIKTAIGPVLVAIGGIMEIVGEVVQNVIAPILKTIGEILVPLFKLLNPILLLATGFIKLVSSALEKVTEFLVPVVQRIAGIVQSISGVILEGVGKIESFGSNIMIGLGTIIEKLTGNSDLKDAGTELQQTAQETIESGKAAREAGWAAARGEVQTENTTTSMSSDYGGTDAIPTPVPSTGMGVDVWASGNEDSGDDVVARLLQGIGTLTNKLTKTVTQDIAPYQDPMMNKFAKPLLSSFYDYKSNQELYNRRVHLPMLSSMKNDIVPLMESMLAIEKENAGINQSFYGNALSAMGLLLGAAGQESAGNALWQTGAGMAANGLTLTMEGATAQANAVSYQLNGKPFYMSKLYEEPAEENTSTEETEGETTVEDVTSDEPNPTDRNNPSTDDGTGTTITPSIPSTPQTTPTTPSTPTTVVDPIPGVTPSSSTGGIVRVHPLNTFGSGDSQGSYGGYLNMSRRGCGPIALADAFARRRGGNVNAGALAGSMASAGTYSTSRGTSVGGFLNTASAMGMGYRVGGVTQGSLHHATPNNPITLVGSGGGFGTRNGNTHYVNVIGTDHQGGAYVSNPLTGRVEHRSTNDLVSGSVVGLYGSGDTSIRYDLGNIYGNGEIPLFGLSQVIYNSIKNRDTGTGSSSNGSGGGGNYRNGNGLVLGSYDKNDILADWGYWKTIHYKNYSTKPSETIMMDEFIAWRNSGNLEAQDYGMSNPHYYTLTPQQYFNATGIKSNAYMQYEAAADEAEEKKAETFKNPTLDEVKMWLSIIQNSDPDYYEQIKQAHERKVSANHYTDSRASLVGWVRNELIKAGFNAKKLSSKDEPFTRFKSMLKQMVGAINVAPNIESLVDKGQTAEEATAANQQNYYDTLANSSQSHLMMTNTPGGLTGYISMAEKYASDNATMETDGQPSTSDRIKNSMSGLKEIFSKILSIFSFDTNSEIDEELEKGKEQRTERTIRESVGNEEYDSYEEPALEYFKNDNPKYDGESDEAYEQRIAEMWPSHKQKYMNALSKQNATILNAMNWNGAVDAANGVSSTNYGDYDPATGTWSSGLWNAMSNGGGSTITETSYNDPYAGKFVSDQGVEMWTGGYTPEIFETNITENGGSSQSQSPVHEFFWKTSGLDNGVASDYSFSKNGNWFAKRSTPDTTGKGSTDEEHKGVDILTYPASGMQAGNSELHAITGGKVLEARGDGVIGDRNSNGGWGNTVAWEDAAGYIHRYAHMKESPTVHADETLTPGQLIGKIGSTGWSTGEHVHYQIEDPNGSVINPMTYFKYHKPSTSNGASQGEIAYEGSVMQSKDAWAVHEKKHHDEWPLFIQKAQNAGMTPAEIATIISTGIWEDGAEKFFGEKSLTGTTYDSGGQRAEGIMNWVEKGVAAGTVEDQLKYIKDRYWRMQAMEGRPTSGTYRDTIVKKGGESIFKKMTGRSGFTLNPGDRYADKLNSDLIEGSTYFYQGDLQPDKVYTVNGLAENVGTAVGVYNWLLKNGYANPAGTTTNSYNVANAVNQAEIGSGTGAGTAYDEYSDREKNKKLIWSYLRNNMGYTKEGAAGALGNLRAESGLYPMVIIGHESPDDYNKSLADEIDRTHTWPSRIGDKAYGLVQWMGDRRTRMIKKATDANVSVVDLPTQLSYMADELNSSYYSKVNDKMKSASSVQDASDYWQDHFEVCGDARDKRRNYSNQYYNELKDFNGTAVDANGGTAVTAVDPANSLWINTLNRAIKATDDAGYHTYSQDNKFPIQLDGKTITSRMDCTGMYGYALQYLGYDLDSFNAMNLRLNAEAGKEHPITKDGVPSEDFTAMKYSSVGKEGVQIGDILVEPGHGEVAYGSVNGTLKGWNFGEVDPIRKTQAAASRILGGESIDTVMTGPDICNMSTPTYVIRPSGELTVPVAGSSSGTSVGTTGMQVGKFNTAINWTPDRYGYGGATRNGGFINFAKSSQGGISNRVYPVSLSASSTTSTTGTTTTGTGTATQLPDGPGIGDITGVTQTADPRPSSVGTQYSNSGLATQMEIPSKQRDRYYSRNGKVPTKVTWHVWDGSGEDPEKLLDWWNKRYASVNYGIGSTGIIKQEFDEGYGPHTSKSQSNDTQAVTLEIANEPGYSKPDYKISKESMQSAINLTVDIAKRNGIKQFNYTGDGNGNWTYHKMFADTSCPGKYIEDRTNDILNVVNGALAGSGDEETTFTIPPIPDNIYDSIQDTGFGIQSDGFANNVDGIYGRIAQPIYQTNNYTIAKAYSEDEDTLIQKLMSNTFNVRALQVEALLEEISRKMDQITNKTTKNDTPQNVQTTPNLFNDQSIPKQIQRLAKG